MSEQMEPGPALDAKLAEAMGWKAWKEQRGEYALCVTQAPRKPAPWMNYRHQERARQQERYAPISCAQAASVGFFGQGFPEFSTNPSAAISAAEECRKAGRIDGWQIGYDPLLGEGFAMVKARNHWNHLRGDVAAALVLALLDALTGDRA